MVALALFPLAAQAQTPEPWTVDRVDRNTIVVHGNPPGLERLDPAQPDALTATSVGDAQVFRGSSAMIDKLGDTLAGIDSPGRIIAPLGSAMRGSFPGRWH
ncbi:hypothetical protein D3874_14810 [Oleomonas cavernae]|uniref:Uncharacterized protein n=1 Tax=Oleomonas cavernae TaxID=2320859 RepID=A0A418WDN5_9PROT|nr:hypothetical protein D3874_14810 [Oleomonas cavernae]